MDLALQIPRKRSAMALSNQEPPRSWLKNIDASSHPAARLFPMMTDAELSELAEDIKQNGQLEPIWLYNGMILDGRNRAAACVMLSITPITKQVETSSPVQFVISRNLRRRHLTTGQQADIAAEMVPMLHEEAKKRQEAGLKIDTLAQDCAKGKATEIAAKAVGVSPRTVEKVVAIKKHNPDLAEKVKAGEIKVNAAYEQVRESQRSAKELGTRKGETKQPTARDIQRAKSHKDRMAKSLGSVSGAIMGLTEVLDVALIRAACTPTELKRWVKEVKELASGLNQFAKKLEREGVQ